MEIIEGIIQSTVKTFIYGVEGIGKSTLASKFPKAIFIDVENRTKHLNIRRLCPASFIEIEEALRLVCKQKDSVNTIVIDGLEFVERRLTEHLCSVGQKESIGDFPHGSGYAKLEEKFFDLIGKIDKASGYCDAHVVLIGHSEIRKVEEPGLAETYDHYEPSADKRIKKIVKNWADMTLFCNYKTSVIESDNRKIGVGGEERIIYTSHTAAWDAKNSFDLPSEIPMEYKSIKHIIEPKTIREKK